MTIVLYLIGAVCGFFAKLADSLSDAAKKPAKKWMANFAGALSGISAGILVFYSAEFAAVLAAIAIGTLAAGKIDARPHQIALAIVLLAVLLAMPKIALPEMVLFSALVLLDELLNDFSDRAKSKKSLVKRLLGARLSMEIGTAVIWAVTGNYGYLLAVISFDAGYWVSDALKNRLLAD